MTELEQALAAGGQVVGGGQTDLQAALAAGGQVVPGQAPPNVSTGESIARGAFQGVTFGFGDELSGLVRSLVDGTSYQQERDAARTANKQASEANPFAYGASELAAGIATPIPGLGAAKAGASIAKSAAKAAVAGGAAGLGASEADLTKGDFGGAVNDTVSSALLGGAIGAVGGKIGQMVGKSGAKAEDQAIRALAGAESKNSGAAWQKTRRMVNNPETKAILREQVPVEMPNGKVKTTTLEQAAGKEPTHIQDIVEAQTARINDEIRPIYAKADAKNGGVQLSKYIQHLDDQIKATSSMAPAEARVYRNAIGELRENALEQWGDRAVLPSEAIRAEATALQKIGFKTVDPLNPGLSTQVKRDMGNMVRKFVNEHVMQTLGGEDHSRLLGLNKRMNAWLGVGTVAEARAEKAAAGRMSGRGGISDLVGKASSVAGLVGAVASGNPVPLLAMAAPAVIGRLPSAARGATRNVAKVDARLKAIADAAASGNPWAQKFIQSLQQTPGGIARVAALQKSGEGAPPAIAPESIPDAQPVASR